MQHPNEMNAIFAVSALKDLSPLEVHKIYKLRVDVFVHEQRAPYKEIDEIDAQDTTLHVQAWSPQREILGVARVFPEGSVVRLGRFVVAKEQRGTGLGRELLFQTLRLIHEQYPGRETFIHTQSALEGYYAAYGFIRSGSQFEEDGIPHLPMTLSAEKLAHLF